MDNQITISYNNLPVVIDIFRSMKENCNLKVTNRNARFHVLVFVVSGQYHVYEDGIKYSLGKGDIIFIRKNTTYNVVNEESSKYIVAFDYLNDIQQINLNEYGVIPRNLTFLQNYYTHKIVLPKKLKVSNPDFVEKKINELIELGKTSGDSKFFNINFELMKLFLDFHRQSEQQKPPAKIDVTVRKIKDYIDNHCLDSIESQNIADTLIMNYNYLANIFKKSTGMTIMQYHAQSRIYKAIELMRSSNLNISQISYKVGFKDPYHFSRVFKSIIGVSPANYMKQLQLYLL